MYFYILETNHLISYQQWKGMEEFVKKRDQIRTEKKNCNLNPIKRMYRNDEFAEKSSHPYTQDEMVCPFV